MSQFVQNGQTQPEFVTGKDGKQYPARKQRRTVSALDSKDTETALGAIKQAGWTLQRIAEASGVSKDTVQRAVGDFSFENSEIPNTRGQKRPAKYLARRSFLLMNC